MAVGEVSENPSGNSVARPTDTQIRDADIDRKLRLYGIGHAFSNGKYPSNKQINVALTSAVKSDMLTKPSKDLSAEGRELVKDLCNVIDSAKYLWLRKNYNQELQNFLYYTIQASATPDSSNINAPVSKDQAQQHGQDSLQGLRTLGRLLVTNGQFRKLLSDSTLLIRDMLADGAASATGMLRPDQERLDRLDELAPNHQWHEEPPSFSEVKDNLRSKLRGGQQQVQQHAEGVSRDASQAATGQAVPQEAGARAADEYANNYSRGDVDQSAGASTAWQSTVQRVSDAVPDEHKARFNEFKGRTTDYLNSKIPQERRDKAIFRLKKMVVEIQQHDDYQDAIDTLLSLAEEYAGHAKSVAKDTHGEVIRTAGDSNIQKAHRELRTLLENFADYTSMDDMFDAGNNLITDANNDPEFEKWWEAVDRFIRKCLKEDGYILRDESTDEWNRLQDRGNHFLNERYKEHTDRLTDEMNRWFNFMSQDPDNVEFGNKVQKLFLDLGQDKNGNVKFKPHLLTDVTNVIIPGFFEHVRYIPVPRIEVCDPRIDAVIENIVIESENLMPNIFEIQADTFWRFGRKKIQNKNVNRFHVHASQIQCDLKDVAYWIHKKQGFPTIKDTGLMDLFLGGQGLSFNMRLVTAENADSHRFFKVENVHVTIKNLNITLKKSNHKALFGFFKPLLMGVVKPAIAKAAEVQIRKSFDQLDEQMWLVQNEYNKAKEAAKNQPPEESQNMVNMYIQAIQRRFTEIKESGKEKVGNVGMATTKETSKFPNVHLESGISTRATKFREMAREGDGWRCPIFDIGSAQPIEIPAPKKITRKSPYQNTRATINERGQGQTGTTGIGDMQYNNQQIGSGRLGNAHIGNNSAYTSLDTVGAGYQPRMSTAADSMSTAVEGDNDIQGTYVGKYNVTGSKAPQDPLLMPYSDGQDTYVASQDPSRRVV